MELIVLSALCALIGLGCLAGLAWAILGGVDTGVERIFLIHVWGLFAALFLGMAAWIYRQRPRQAKKEAGSSPAAQAEEKPVEAGKAAP